MVYIISHEIDCEASTIDILDFGNIDNLIKCISVDDDCYFPKNVRISYYKCNKTRKIMNRYIDWVVCDISNTDLDILDTFIETYFDKCSISEPKITDSDDSYYTRYDANLC